MLQHTLESRQAAIAYQRAKLNDRIIAAFQHSKHGFHAKAIELVDAVYDQLHVAAIEYNFSRDQIERISGCSPTFVTEAKSTYYRSRISAPSWSLTMRAIKNEVEFFLIRTDRVLGFSNAEDDVAPFLRLRYSGNCWMQQHLEYDLVESTSAFAHFLFKKLTKKCQSDEMEVAQQEQAAQTKISVGEFLRRLQTSVEPEVEVEEILPPPAKEPADEIHEALSTVVNAADGAVTKIAECGSKAFLALNFDEVQSLRDLALRLCEYKSRASLIREDWSNNATANVEVPA